MQARITVVTLAVDNLGRSLHFYREGLGFQTAGIVGTEFEHGAVVFIDLQAGLKLALWPRSSLARDSGLALGPPCPTGLSLGHNVASRDEVDAVMKKVPSSSSRRRSPSGVGMQAGPVQRPRRSASGLSTWRDSTSITSLSRVGGAAPGR